MAENKGNKSSYFQILNNAALPSAVTDSSNNILWINKAFEKLFSCLTSDAAGKSIFEFVSFDAPENEPQDIEAKIARTKSSDPPELLLSAAKIFIEGKVNLIFAFTDFSRYSDKWTVLSGENNDSASKEYVFVRKLTQKILSPVYNIRERIDALKERKNIFDTEEKEAYEAIDESLGSIIRKISYLLSAGGFSTECYDSVDLKEIISDLMAYYGKAYREIRFDVFFPKRDIKIAAIKELFTTALKNVLDNSVEAMERKGLIKIALQVKKKSVLVKITDSGGGIRKDVFENFFNSVSTKEKGHGYGAKDSRDISRIFGGDLFIENFPGKGAAFTFVFPCI